MLTTLDIIEEELQKLYKEAEVADGQERIERFKKHLTVLKTDSECKSLINQLKHDGFETGFPVQEKDFLTLNILGLKPTTLNMTDLHAQNLINRLIHEKKITNILYVHEKIISQPTIPFKVIFESYKNGSYGWETSFSAEDEYNLADTFKNIDDPHDIAEKLKNFNDFGSSSNVNTESGSALFLGLQPICSAIYLKDNHLQEFFKNFHILLETIPYENLPDYQKIEWDTKSWANSKTRSLNVWGGPSKLLFIRNDKEKKISLKSELLPSLTFCGNLENYRFSLYTGYKAYNDHSWYIQLLGLFMEYFFRSAFDDNIYLQILLNRILLSVNQLSRCLKNSYIKDLTKNQAWHSWNAFNNDVTGPQKNLLTAEKKESYPPLEATFEMFISEIFGQTTWERDASTGIITIEEKNRDKALYNFLRFVALKMQKTTIAKKIGLLHEKLSALQQKLKELNHHLAQLKKSF